MKTIKYKFANGDKSEVEVSDDLYDFYMSLRRKETNSDKTETRRHVSLDTLVESSTEPTVNDDYFADNQVMFTNPKLERAFKLLSDKQQELIIKVFWQDMTVSEVARQEGVSVPNISMRLQRIYKKLRKILKNS